jgi:hypothetical protein
MPDGRARGGRDAWAATAAYCAATIVMTWPLATGLARDVAWDLGDSLLNMWALAWDCEQLRAVLGGDIGRIRTFFDANIFYPAPLTLAYSEHLFAQAVQIFPVYLATKNPILCYNLLFVSTFVLSGLGMYLLVREVTGRPRAAFVAGLLFAFVPYRLVQAAHLQVLSSQWMPLTLYGFRRYLDSGRRLPLWGGTVALITQNLSCGYFLLYFAPFAAAYVLWEIAARSRWRDRRLWIDFLTAAAVTVIATAPFLIPYARVREQLRLTRSLAEIVRFSADVYAYFTAFPAQRLWAATANTFPRAEGELFMGALPLLLAAVGVGVWLWRGILQPSTPGAFPPSNRGTRWLAAGLVLVATLHAAAIVGVIFLRRYSIGLGIVSVRVSDGTRPLLVCLACVGALLAVSPAVRRRAAALGGRPEAFFLFVLVMAWWLSLGPSPRVLGRPVEIFAPYAVLLDHVPGYDGMRVPARFAMVVALALSVLAGFGAAAVDRGRAGALVLSLVAAAVLVEANGLPFQTNGVTGTAEFAPPPSRVYRPGRAPEVYQAVARGPAELVLLELPLDTPDYDLRALYYSTVHWRPLVNGYSGFFPPHYSRLGAALRDIARHPDLSWEAIRASGATHVIVHEAAYRNDEGREISRFLTARGATDVYRDGTDVLFAVP